MRHEGQDRERRKVREAEAETKSQYPVPEVPKKVDSGGNLRPLIEFSTEARDDPNEGLTFGDMPERCTCPHCERAVVTFIDYEASWVTWLLAIVVWFSLGWMAFWVLPLLWPAFKDVVHHCPRCLNVIARKSRISLPTFRTEVCSIKVGNCAVVLARKYVIVFLGLLATIVAVYCLRSFVHVNGASPEVSKGAPSKLNWEDFLFDCGPKSSLRSRGSSALVFDEKYRRRTFTWQGEVRVIREGFEVFFIRTKSVLMVRMYPSRFPRRDLPDVALLFSDSLNKEISELSPGDWVEFEATMTLHGYRGDPELMTLWHIQKVDRPSPLSSSGHSQRAVEEPEQKMQKDAKEPPAPKVEEPQKTEQPIPDAQQEASGRPQDSQPKEPEATKELKEAAESPAVEAQPGGEPAMSDNSAIAEKPVTEP